MKRLVEHQFIGDTTPYSEYDHTKTNLGVLIRQYSGPNPTDNFAGPMKVGFTRPFETAGAMPGRHPHTISWSDEIDWVFLADAAVAGATRRITLFEYNRTTSLFTFKGMIVLTHPTATTKIIVGMRIVYATYITGTVSVSGVTVTGSGTVWGDSRIFVGSRIGFGSTDPTQITTWYEIGSVDSNTAITLISSAGTIDAGTSYVIEDLKILTGTIDSGTGSVPANGGLFMVGGLRPETFSPGGNVIPAATTVDKQRAVYWLADMPTVTNTVAGGCTLDDFVSWTEQYCYIINVTASTTPQIYKYNFRAPLNNLSSGKTTEAFVLRTGLQTVTGTVSQNNNGRIGILKHGPGANEKCLYFATTTRICRVNINDINADSTAWIADSMAEIPPGGVNTYAATGALSAVEIADSIDRLIITSTGASGARSYVTQYNTESNPFDHIFLIDSKQWEQTISDPRIAPHPNILAVTTSASALTVWSERGLTYIARPYASAANALYVIPLSADWAYANNSEIPERLITPALETPGASEYVRVYFNQTGYLGSGPFTLPTEPARIYYRTGGIVDNSGEWSLVDNTGNLTGITGADYIQFAFEFRTMGTFCLPAQIYNVAVVYEDNTTDPHYELSIGLSLLAESRFTWRLATAFGTAVPPLRIRLFDAVSDNLLLDDNTIASPTRFAKTTDSGENWLEYDNNDKTNENTYIRYTPSSLGPDIKTRALLTLL